MSSDQKKLSNPSKSKSIPCNDNLVIDSARMQVLRQSLTDEFRKNVVKKKTEYAMANDMLD